ncbi:DUF397 domain-containing protein [Streptomyces sp. NPDC057621]|uniref:DUF397 domain-containing protein n=1 Tax=Streptomyces sp. NPDC057621 TaxID=3346186 RepID=UPI00367426F1
MTATGGRDGGPHADSRIWDRSQTVRTSKKCCSYLAHGWSFGLKGGDPLGWRDHRDRSKCRLVPFRAPRANRVRKTNQMYRTWAWCKSSASDLSGNQCVEVACTGQSILVRDSKEVHMGFVTFSPTAWSSFLHGSTVENSKLRD